MTRLPRSFNSSARTRVNSINPPLPHAYPLPPTGRPPFMLMMMPSSRSIMCGSTSRTVSSGPSRFTVTSCHHSSGSTSYTPAMDWKLPALLNSTSTDPKRSRAVWTMRCTWARSVTSAATARASPASALIMRTVSSRRSLRLAQQTTRAPSRAKAVANARPMPLPEPVTMAVRSLRSMVGAPNAAVGRRQLLLLLLLRVRVLLPCGGRG